MAVEKRDPENSYYKDGMLWKVDTKEKYYEFMLLALLDARRAGGTSVSMNIIEEIVQEAELNFGKTQIEIKKPS